jgi:hypothetical protein
MDQVLASRLTVIASVGHFFIQMPQRMHSFMSTAICPLVLSLYSLGMTGYMSVAGFLNKLLITILPIFKFAIDFASVLILRESL